MNEKFFSLPEEKQQAILNAGYRVFSQNTYKNSPMSQIAEAAGISKSLLFHYFHNKKGVISVLMAKMRRYNGRISESLPLLRTDRLFSNTVSRHKSKSCHYS